MRVERAIDWTDAGAVAEARRLAGVAALADALGMPRTTPIDELLLEVLELHPDVIGPLQEYVDAMATLELAERRLLEVGRLHAKHNDKETN